MPGSDGDQVLILGGSIAGLLAARVLAERFERVVVVERDPLPQIGEHRRGVPHGRHLHGLHPRGREILDELFPGFTETLIADGAVGCDILGDLRWQLSGQQLRQAAIGLPALFASRPFLEGHVRAMVQRLPAVRILERRSICGLTTTPDRKTITGAEVRPAAGGEPERIAASLVLDATGRGSRTPVWLGELGYPQPAQDRVEIGLGYATRTYRLRPDAMAGDQMILTAATLANPRTGVLAVTEGGRHMLTIAGIGGDHPPADPAGFDAFVAALPTADIAAAIAGAQPLDNPVPFRFPASVRHRYERLTRFPAGLLVIGDAVCSFNPVYGQGITVAAVQAMTLRRLLTRPAVPDARRYFRAIAAAIDVPWDIAVGADLAFPQIPGPRPAKVRLVNAYLPRLHAAAARDDTLAAALVRVIGLKDRPQTLLRPDRVIRVLRGNLAASRKPPVPPVGESWPSGGGREAEGPDAQGVQGVQEALGAGRVALDEPEVQGMVDHRRQRAGGHLGIEVPGDDPRPLPARDRSG
jgi:2-polyprenyl-6-methoxyphenol hydroxylase-like FAD-dependent oxidoreductase